MVMDGKDIQSDLGALKRLFGLLRNDRDGTTNTDSDLLDEHSRLVLKNLLDAATKRVLLKLHSEGQVEASSGTRYPTHEQGIDTGKDSKMDGLDVSLWKETRLTPRWSQAGASGCQQRQKRCRVCQRNTVKQQLEESTGETRFYDVVRKSNRFSDPQKNESDSYLQTKEQEMCNPDVEAKSKSGEEVDCVSKEASEAIKQIELCISAFRIGGGADHLHLLDNNCAQPHSFLCQLSTQKVVDPMYLLFQPTKAVMLGQSTNNFISTYKPSSGTCTNLGAPDPPKIMGETKPSRVLVSSGFHENRKDGISRNRHQESDEETGSRDSGSDSEEYSLTDGSREVECVSSSRSSGSWGTPGSGYSSYISNGEEEDYSSSSGEGAPQVTFSSSSSSKSEGYSYEEPIRSYAKKSGPRAYGINHKKQSGVWKRLKDRLAIIFHHHHHHHDDDQTKMSRGTCLDKRKGKVVNFKKRDEAHGEKAVEKTRKSRVREKGQHGHFHGLMEGLLRHVRHSKQSKSGKGNVGQHGRKKTLNESHWWQLLEHHRGAKLHNKTHRKLELGKEKGRLKVLPSIK